MPYGSFATVYDELMDDVPYDRWAGWYTGRLRSHGIEDGLVLDLGCGTGELTGRLSDQGYDMIGVDASEDMLSEARGKAGGRSILYLQQDMRSFELYGTVRAVISSCDTMNYLLTEEDLEQVLRLVRNYLDPGGVFLFDMNTSYKYRELIGDTTIAETRDDCAFIWENSWFEDEKLNQYDLTLFERGTGGLYRRSHELHTQRGWEMPEVRAAAERCGLDWIAAYEDFTMQAAAEERPCGRVVYETAKPLM